MKMHNEPLVTLVDINNQPRGTATKSQAHNTPMLHRAFSVFLYHGDKMLIQRRALDKYHSGGLWSNSCCSHPRPDETLEAAVQNRMELELGITDGVEVKELLQFTYFCRFHDSLFEYEYDHVFLGQFSGTLTLNPQEASQSRWITLDDLSRDLVENPQSYSVWFLGLAPRVIAALRAQEERNP